MRFGPCNCQNDMLIKTDVCVTADFLSFCQILLRFTKVLQWAHAFFVVDLIVLVLLFSLTISLLFHFISDVKYAEMQSALEVLKTEIHKVVIEGNKCFKFLDLWEQLLEFLQNSLLW